MRQRLVDSAVSTVTNDQVNEREEGIGVHKRCVSNVAGIQYASCISDCNNIKN